MCHQHKILVRFQPLTGELNVLAIPTEWTLCPRVFRAIAREIGDPSIDLCATALNHQTQVYIGPFPDPNALALDALSIDWSSLPLAYCFPLMPILPKVLQKIRHHTGGSGMADPVLVPGPTQSLHGSPTRDSGRPRPSLADGATQDLEVPQPRNVQLLRLDVVRNSLKASLFSSDCRQNLSPTTIFYQIHL